MAFTTGTVEYIKFGGDFGVVRVLNEADGRPELFLLWFGDTTGSGPIALYTMQLTIALARKLRVEIMHEPSSAFIDRVILYAPP